MRKMLSYVTYKERPSLCIDFARRFECGAEMAHLGTLCLLIRAPLITFLPELGKAIEFKRTHLRCCCF